MAGCVLATVLGCAVGRAQAEPTADDKALATVLFQEGRALMSAGRIADACLKLDESQRLDPSGGTLLNLALCHEQEGTLARSWSEFNDAAVLARRDGRRDRETAANAHALALAPRLSKLTIVVPAAAAVNGLRIERDGRELGRGSWFTAMPVDGGAHVVRATAPDRQSFTTTIVIGNEADVQSVEIPSLSPTLVQAAGATVPDGGSHHVRRTAGWVLGGAGLVQLGLAGYFVWRALDEHCLNNVCGTEEAAGRAADVSTVFTITGVATAGVGIYLLLTSRDSASPARSTLTLDVSSRGVTVGGRF